MRESGPCKPGGVDEVLRASVDEPLRDTQEVSMTRTPMLRWLGGKNGEKNKIKINMNGDQKKKWWKQGMESGEVVGEVVGERRYLCIFLMLR